MQIKYKGCDISHHQSKVDFSKLRHEVDFVILKLGGTDTKNGSWYKDNKFDTYYKECKKHKIPVGCYWFAGTSSVGTERGIFEGSVVKKLIDGLQFEMPIFLDFEQGNTISKILNTEFCKTFCDYLESRKYFVGIYASDILGFKNMLNLFDLRQFTLWVARYGRRPVYVGDWGMWQYTSTGKLNGISGNVDLDYSVKDFPKIIKRRGLNGFE